MNAAHGMARWIAIQLNEAEIGDKNESFQIIVTDVANTVAQITYDYDRERWTWEDGVDIRKLDVRTRRF